MKIFYRTVVYDESLRIEALFNPGDNHACVQSDDGTLDYRGFNISKEIMLDLAEEVTGKWELQQAF